MYAFVAYYVYNGENGGACMLALDHIVIAARTRADVCLDGIRAVRGGVHGDWGTSNELAFLNNHCYVEWLFIDDVKKAAASDNPLIEHVVFELDVLQRTGAFQLALRTEQMDAFINRFEEQNIAYLGPFAGARQKPDGTLLSWKMLFPLYDRNEETLPFLIQWDQPEHEPINTSHINNKQLTDVYLGTVTAERMAEVYGLEASNKIKLANCTLHITKDGAISFTIV